MANYTGIAATTAAVTNRFVTSTNMIVGAYTLANTTPVWQGGCLVTLTHTTVAAGTETLGTVALVGVGIDGQTQSETLTPVADSTVTSVYIYRSVTSLTGAGWVIAGGNDTIVAGVAAGAYLVRGQGQLFAVVVNTTAAAAITLSDSKRTIATLKASIAEGHYLYGTGLDFTGYLKVATTSTNDITVLHSASLPASIAG